MADFHIPDTKEIYQIAYLVNNGWKYNIYSFYWEKSGCSQHLNINSGFGVLCKQEIVLTTEFTTEQAFQLQDDIDNDKK